MSLYKNKVHFLTSLSQACTSLTFPTIDKPGSLLSAFHHHGLAGTRPQACRLLNVPAFFRKFQAGYGSAVDATRAACYCLGRGRDGLLFFCRLVFLLFVAIVISGCELPAQEPNIPVEPNIIESKAWTDYSAQWPIRLNGVTYIHQMRERKNGRGVEAQFVRYMPGQISQLMQPAKE